MAIPVSKEMQSILMAARGTGKCELTLEYYRKLVGISDEAWEEMIREAEKEKELQNDQT